MKSGGIDNGARVTTVNSSGASRVSPKVRVSEPAPQPLNKTTAIAGAISRTGVDRCLMAISLSETLRARRMAIS